MNSNPLYQRAFEELGRTWEINEQTVVHIELFVSFTVQKQKK